MPFGAAMAIVSAGSGSLSPDPSSAPSLPRSSATFGPVGQLRRRSTSSERDKAPESSIAGSTSNNPRANAVSEVSVNGTPTRAARPAKKAPTINGDGDDVAWGSNFWVTLVDPQVCSNMVQVHLLVFIGRKYRLELRFLHVRQQAR